MEKNFVNYLLNVDSRVDRLQNVSERFLEIDQQFTRVSAITGLSLIESEVNLLTRPNTEANWRSIQKIFQIFLASKDEYCFVFEDDVVFNPEFKMFRDNFVGRFDQQIDVLQFGFLVFDGKNDDRKRNILKVRKAIVNSKILNFLDFVMGKLIDREKFFPFLRGLMVEHKKRKLMESQLGLNVPLLRSFEPGTHGFIIGRRMAELVVNYNLPMVMSADLVFMTLSKNKAFQIYRTGLPLAGQDDSPPSINGHASKSFDIAYETLR